MVIGILQERRSEPRRPRAEPVIDMPEGVCGDDVATGVVTSRRFGRDGLLSVRPWQSSEPLGSAVCDPKMGP